MMIGDKAFRAPQLLHRKPMVPLPVIKSVVDREHYELSIDYPFGDERVNYSLIVRYYWDGETWNHYSFGQYDMGDFEEIVSRDEADAREQAYLDHEGKLDEFYRPRVIRGIEKDIQAALIRRWEALCELVSPHVTF